jgi:hypothetical protein
MQDLVLAGSSSAASLGVNHGCAFHLERSSIDAICAGFLLAPGLILFSAKSVGTTGVVAKARRTGDSNGGQDHFQ